MKQKEYQKFKEFLKMYLRKELHLDFYRDVELPEPFFKEGTATKKYQELEGVNSSESTKTYI
jgi:hypothetical protein